METCVDEIPFWMECPAFSIPENALKGGYYNGEYVYIGRAMHQNALTPGTSSIFISKDNFF